jgi:insecticidal toxin complex protein TccC
MSTMNLHSNTPQLTVVDPRMLSIRKVAYCRSDQGTEPDERITRRAWDVAARAVADWDPRLWGAGLSANTAVIHSLSGQALLEENVDAGWRLNLSGADGQVQEYWDQRGSHGRTAYDDLLRPVSVTQTLLGAVPLVVERLLYGDASASCATHNQCGRLIRHDDPAGTLHTLEFGLTGAVLIENRHFLQSLQLPDWPIDPSQRNELLEPGEGHTTSSLFDATATLVSQTDAVGNSQMHRYTVDGQLKETSLQLAERTSVHALVSNINYNPLGQVESERLGNGVVTENSYEPETGRLTQLKASKPDRPVLQHLIYQYEPVGNILSIEDLALSPTAARNVNADPVSRYRYDSLYQLIEASGREVKVGASHGPTLPELQNLPLDPNQLSNYTQTYNYDAGGNLLQMRHVGEQSFTRTMLIAANSNRSLPEGETDADFDNGFDANGNLRQLLRGQSMSWDQRNQLSLITPVSREDSLNDEEIYSYDAGGQRCRKTRRAMASGRTLVSEVRYLPGLEIRSEPNGEILYVACAQAGRSNVRILHWQANKPDGIDNDQVRYNLADHLGSSALELDGQAALISHEGYYPFAGTAWWTARSAVEAKYKMVRYSGKERDASGLYYYGFRYYAPWLMRWLNPDPAGTADGLNLYRFVSNSPISHFDTDGKRTTELDTAAGKVYVSDGLEARLEQKKRAAPDKYARLEEAYTHNLYRDYKIISKSPANSEGVQSWYDNTFEPHQWTFDSNFRAEKSEPAIYANEVAMEQYLRVARKHGFMGQLPSMIKRSTVMNEGVCQVAENYISGSDELKNAFLNETQNGKSTQRILDDFGLKATRVEARFSPRKDLDILVHIEPITPIASPPNPGLRSNQTRSGKRSLRPPLNPPSNLSVQRRRRMADVSWRAIIHACPRH